MLPSIVLLHSCRLSKYLPTYKLTSSLSRCSSANSIEILKYWQQSASYWIRIHPLGRKIQQTNMKSNDNTSVRKYSQNNEKSGWKSMLDNFLGEANILSLPYRIINLYHRNPNTRDTLLVGGGIKL
jgi:hypothetical protein